MSHLDEWNALSEEQALVAVLPCCGSRAWAAGVASRRPLGTLPELLAASDAAWWTLGSDDWLEAFASHPRIGERQTPSSAGTISGVWSSSEQHAVMEDRGAIRQAIADGNRAYEERFGHVFLIRAAGRDTREILAELHRRMRNTAEAELQEAAQQQREITHLRLQRWLAERETELRTP